MYNKRLQAKISRFKHTVKEVFKLFAILVILCLLSIGHSNAEEQTNEWQHYKHEWYYENFLKDDITNTNETDNPTHEVQLGNGATNACCGCAHIGIVDDVTGEIIEIKACEFYEQTGRCYLTADEWYNRLINDNTGYWHNYFLDHGYYEQFSNNEKINSIFGNEGETAVEGVQAINNTYENNIEETVPNEPTTTYYMHKCDGAQAIVEYYNGEPTQYAVVDDDGTTHDFTSFDWGETELGTYAIN